MDKDQRFLIVKTKDSKEIRYFEYNKIDGYSLTPKSNIHFEDAIDVNRMIIINPSLIEKIVDKKIKRKFDTLITMLGIVCEEDDQSGEGYKLALDEAEKFRGELVNKYKRYLENEKLDLMFKKISILEDELKLRLQAIIDRAMEIEEEYNKEGKSR